MARAYGADLMLLRVVPPTLLSRAAGAVWTTDRAVHSDDEDAARSYLEAVAENLRKQGVAVSVRVRRGAASSCILEESTHGDLLALCSRGAGLLPRLLLGSVALQVLPSASCPVLLIQAQQEKSATSGKVRSFAEDAEHLGALMQRPLGLRTVALDRIVGSVGRAHELGPTFLPRDRPQGDARFKRIRSALERGAVLPPVDLYKLGHDYYVLDGHHRVAAARATGQLETDAVVTEFLPVGDAAMQRLFLERRAFEDATGLTRIGVARPGHYARLRTMIERFAREQGIEDLKDAAARWYAQVYLPMAARLRAARLVHSFPGERSADLVVHVEDLREEEEARRGRPVSWEEALEQMVRRYRNSKRHARLRVPDLRRLVHRT